MGLFSKSKSDKNETSNQKQSSKKTPDQFDARKFHDKLKAGKIRLNLHKNKTSNSAKTEEREVAVLLNQDKEALAKVRMEQVIRNELMCQAMDNVEMFCEVLGNRSTMIASGTSNINELPMDLREAVCSVVFAVPRFGSIPELQEVIAMLRIKYGDKDISELMSGAGSNLQYVSSRCMEGLKPTPPEGRLVLSQMSQVAKTYQVDWKPPAEYEDLNNQSYLTGPNNYGNAVHQPMMPTNIPGYNPGQSFGGPAPPTYGNLGYGPSGGTNASPPTYGSTNAPAYGMDPYGATNTGSTNPDFGASYNTNPQSLYPAISGTAPPPPSSYTGYGGPMSDNGAAGFPLGGTAPPPPADYASAPPPMNPSASPSAPEPHHPSNDTDDLMARFNNLKR